MAVIINGIKFSYDYSEMINEIQEDIIEGILSPNGEIYVIRDAEPRAPEYYPIIDYYYIDTEENIKEEIAEAKLYKDDFLYQECKEDLDHFLKNKKLMTKISVSALLKEMNDWNSTI